MPARHDQYIHKILSDIEAGHPVSQRSLSKDLGVAVGLVNLLIRRLVTKGYVKVTTIPAKRVRYALTPSGIVEKARISRMYFANTVRLYTETRERIRASLEAISLNWPTDDTEKLVVFYGAGEVAEIAYISLQSTDLRLAGVVDDYVAREFFGHTVLRPEALNQGALNGHGAAPIVIMSFRKSEAMRARLAALGVPDGRVHML